MDRHQQGVTLVELMVVIALLAITAQIALPAWHTFIANNRSQALMHSVERAVFQARSQAITYRMPVELCGSLDGESCGRQWHSGWLMRNLPQGKQPVIEQITRLDPTQLKLQWSGFQPNLRFNAQGYSTISNGRFYLCREQSIDWQLIINRQGRLRRASETENREQDHRCGG